MSSSVLIEAAELARAGTPFVMATVVRAKAPSSAKPGDKALLTEEGLVAGWVGGSCAEPTVRRFAKTALEEGTPRLVQITPRAEESERDGLTVVPMTCFSGGELEIYLEPFVASPHVLVFGNSPTAQAVTTLAVAMGYQARVVDLSERPPMALSEGGRPVPVHRALEDVPALPAGNLFAVVATHGVFDEEAASFALSLGAAYTGVVCSRRRFVSIQAKLRERGVSEEALRRLKGPAGLDLKARGASEVALTILAEIVAVRRGAVVDQPTPAPSGDADVIELAAESTKTGGCCGS